MPYKATNLVRLLLLPLLYCPAFLLPSCEEQDDDNDTPGGMYSFNDNASTRWSSPENRNGVKRRRWQGKQLRKAMLTMRLKQANLMCCLKQMGRVL